jgi:DinB superfamily
VGSAERTVRELATLADALTRIVGSIPDHQLTAPGGEGDWNVAQAAGHVADARAGLCLAASKAATGMWPADARPVVPGVPGPPDADRPTLLHRIARSQRVVERAGRSVAGHEMDDCPLDHPLVGRLRCGEWLMFAGIHDLMHLEQLHDLARVIERTA